jgi:hypothetical protein
VDTRTGRLDTDGAGARSPESWSGQQHAVVRRQLDSDIEVLFVADRLTQRREDRSRVSGSKTRLSALVCDVSRWSCHPDDGTRARPTPPGH